MTLMRSSFDSSMCSFMVSRAGAQTLGTTLDVALGVNLAGDPGGLVSKRKGIRTTPRAAIYGRVATHDQTAENQLLELRCYCEARDWNGVARNEHRQSAD